MRGIIVKGIGGFYYVKTATGVMECKARGKFRNNHLKPMIGDFVEIDEAKGYILDIGERKNELVRPPVANVEKTILIFAAKNPDFNITLLDKFIMMCESKDLQIAICINKCELDRYETFNTIKGIYEKIGYPVFSSSVENDESMREILEFASSDAEKITILSGQSGVGKSTIINKMKPGLEVQTGVISERLKKGKHTTRHVELFELGESFVADTPGFSTLELGDITKEDAKEYFRDFFQFEGQCGFRGCSHTHEPRCAVKAAVEKGEINSERYERYLSIYNELKSKNTYQK